MLAKGHKQVREKYTAELLKTLHLLNYIVLLTQVSYVNPWQSWKKTLAEMQLFRHDSWTPKTVLVKRGRTQPGRRHSSYFPYSSRRRSSWGDSPRCGRFLCWLWNIELCDSLIFPAGNKVVPLDGQWGYINKYIHSWVRWPTCAFIVCNHRLVWPWNTRMFTRMLKPTGREFMDNCEYKYVIVQTTLWPPNTTVS